MPRTSRNVVPLAKFAWGPSVRPYAVLIAKTPHFYDFLMRKTPHWAGLEAIMTNRIITAAIGTFALALGCGSLGCASSSEPPRTAGLAADRARCAEFVNDPSAAEALSRDSIEGVEPLYAAITARTTSTFLVGATIHVRPVKGVTAEWLGRALACRQIGAGPGTLAHGEIMPAFSPDARVEVKSAGDGFRVEVTASTAEEAREILSEATAFSGSAHAMR
jgi:hypothetical protein